ncbi:MAG TPA: hypothetical protein PLT25_05835 [Acidocella sp.]|nr:hypothetical protein [Acidocella sp.]
MNDEFAGQGGSYSLDPVTGKRTLLRRTLPAGSAQQIPQAPEPKLEPQPETAIDPVIQPEKESSV